MGHCCPDLGVSGEASWGPWVLLSLHSEASGVRQVAHALEVRLQGPQLPEPRSSLSPPGGTLSCSSVHMCTRLWDAQLCVHTCIMHTHVQLSLGQGSAGCVAGEVAEGSTCVCGTRVGMCSNVC